MSKECMMAQAQKPVAFVVAMDEEKKDDGFSKDAGGSGAGGSSSSSSVGISVTNDSVVNNREATLAAF